jgi:predicted RNase H-like HicB family nuclease
MNSLYEKPLNLRRQRKTKMKKEFTIVIEQDEDGMYVASVPELEGCHTQAKTLDELQERIKEAIQLYLEVESGLAEEVPLAFVGIQKVEVTF